MAFSKVETIYVTCRRCRVAAGPRRADTVHAGCRRVQRNTQQQHTPRHPHQRYNGLTGPWPMGIAWCGVALTPFRWPRFCSDQCAVSILELRDCTCRLQSAEPSPRVHVQRSNRTVCTWCTASRPSRIPVTSNNICTEDNWRNQPSRSLL